MKNVVDNAQYLAERMIKTGYFDSLNKTQLLPVVAVKLKEKVDFTLYDLSDKLRERGWIIPAYSLPPNAQETVIMRVVVKENFSRDMIDILFDDIVEAYKKLEGKKEPVERKTKKGHRIC